MYKRMYYRLFNTISDVIRLIQEEKYSEASALLMAAQQDAEELYLEGEPS